MVPGTISMLTAGLLAAASAAETACLPGGKECVAAQEVLTAGQAGSLLAAAAGTRFAPETIQALAGIAQAAQANDRMHALARAYELCGKAYECSREGRDRIFALPNGATVRHTYFGHEPFGRKERFIVETPDGRRGEFRASPLVLDLDGDGIRMKDRRVRFDLDADGRADRVLDIARGEGLLCFDRDGDGACGEDGRELLGDRTDLDGDGSPDGFPDGFAALRGLVRRAVREGVLPVAAERESLLTPAHLRTLEDSAGLRVRAGGFGGRALRLREAGVLAIHLSRGPVRLVRDFDGRGDDAMRQEGAAFLRADRSVGAYEDLWLLTESQELARGLRATALPPRRGASPLGRVLSGLKGLPLN